MKGAAMIVIFALLIIGLISWCIWLTSKISRLGDRADLAHGEIQANAKGVSLARGGVRDLQTQYAKMKRDDANDFLYRNDKAIYTECSDDADCGEGRHCSESGCTVECGHDEQCRETIPSSVYGVYPKCLQGKCAPVAGVSAVDMPGIKSRIARTPESRPQVVCTEEGCLANCSGYGWNGISKKDHKCTYASPRPKAT